MAGMPCALVAQQCSVLEITGDRPKLAKELAQKWVIPR